MLSGSFEDELDFFAESIDATSALNLSLAVWAEEDLRSGPEKEYHSVSENCYHLCMRPRSLFESYTRACGKRTLAPYTAPLRAALRSTRRGFKFGLSAMASSVACCGINN